MLTTGLKYELAYANSWVIIYANSRFVNTFLEKSEKIPTDLLTVQFRLIAAS